MNSTCKNVAIVGSTGSIGTSALEVVAAAGGTLRAVALSAHSQLDRLLEQARQLRPRWIVATDEAAATTQHWDNLPKETELLVGHEALQRVVSADEVDIVLAAIVGSAGLRSTWAALKAGKQVALANKEALVIGGRLVVRLAAENHATILPVDSEHSAIFQSMRAGSRREVSRILLTASGGPFRDASPEQLLQVTLDDALAHPTWDMGPKISIDSATLMNKALEIIEARWLFDIDPDQIEVIVHPQSVIHSLVEFVDGSVIAQLSPPDMRLPIQYALHYPDRQAGVAKRIDWTQRLEFDFTPADPERFPALALGHQCAQAGGTSGAVLNAANEAAVQAFLEGDLHFTEIVPASKSVLEEHSFEPDPSLDDLLAADRWARKEISRWVCA